MKILFLSHSFYPAIGGIESNSEVLAHAFSAAGHDVRLLTWSSDSTGKFFPFSVIRNPTKYELFSNHAWADLVFENNPCLRLAWPSLFFGRSSVIALNTWVARINGKIGLQDLLKLIWLRRANRVIAVSDALRKRCWPAAIVINNPYRINEFKIIPNVKRTVDFVFLGRLVSDKGADHAVRAIHNLLRLSDRYETAFSKPSLTIVGEGPERDALERLVADLDLNDHVQFTGPLRGEELTLCLNHHRFLLVPSVWEEPFGNVVLEGMACGCLPIVSDGGGLPDAVGKAGLTFSRGSVDALVASIERILTDPDLEDKLRNAAENHLIAHHPDVISRRYLEVIETVSN